MGAFWGFLAGVNATAAVALLLMGIRKQNVSDVLWAAFNGGMAGLLWSIRP